MHLSKRTHPLVAYREARELSQADFAAKLRKRNRRLRVSGSLISRIEGGFIKTVPPALITAIVAECAGAVPASSLASKAALADARKLLAAAS